MKLVVTQSMQTEIAYGGELLLRLLSVPVYCLVAWALWNSLFSAAGSTQVDGLSLAQMLTYAILGQLLYSFLNLETVFKLEDKVRTGNVVIDLIRPIDTQLYHLWVEAGRSLVNLLARLPLVAAIALLFIPVVWPSSMNQWLGLVVAVLLAFGLVFAVNFLIGALAFWLIEVEPLDHLQTVMQLVLSGAVIPLWFFPTWVEQWASLLPFKFMFQVPMSIFINHLSGTEMLITLLHGTAWVVALLLLGRWVWALGVRQQMVAGG